MRLLFWILLSTLLSTVAADSFSFENYKDTWRREHTPMNTNLSYTGTLHCSLERTWCYQAFYVEQDDFSEDEILHIMELECYDNQSVTHTADFIVAGGDGIGMKTYDMEIELYHNCTNSGQTVRIDHRLPSIHIMQKSGGGNFTWSIVNLGTSFYWKPLGHKMTKTSTQTLRFWMSQMELKREIVNGKSILVRNGNKWNQPENEKTTTTTTTTESPAITEDKKEGSGLGEMEEASGEASGEAFDGVVLEGGQYESMEDYMKNCPDAIPWD